MHSILPGFNQDPQSDASNLAALFGDDQTNEQQIINEMDFRYDPSSVRNPEPIIPKPRSRPYSSANGISEIALGDSIPVEFAEFQTRTVNLSVVNGGEVLRFDDISNGSTLCSISFASFHLSTIGDATAICIGNEIHSRFVADAELSTKLCAIVSAHHVLEPLIFSMGEGDEEVQENSHIIFSQLSFSFSKNQLKDLPEQTADSKHLKMKAKRFEDSFLKYFKGKRAGAKFIVSADGTASCFELKKVRMKNSPASDMISITSDSSRQITPPPTTVNEIIENDTTNPIIANSSTLQTRMSKMGGIQLLPMEIVQPKLQEKELSPEAASVEEAPQPSPRISNSPIPPIVEPANKPIPAERKVSLLNDSKDELEKRVADLEAKVEHLSTIVLQEQVPSNPQSKDKYEFAMDIWATISASPTIPPEAKTEIKKILLSATFQP